MEKQKRLTGFIILLLGMLLMACSGTGQIRTESKTDSNFEELPPVAAIQARESLAEQLDVRLEEIKILTSEQTTWMDSCLGLGGIAESCLRTEVDGWLIELSQEDQIYTAHTDWLGEQVRFEP